MNSTLEPSPAFSTEQKEFLTGFMAGIAQRGLFPYVGTTSGGLLTNEPAQGGPNQAADLTKQERWKLEENPLDSWDRILAHAEANKVPNEEDTFRFRYFGLFYVAPAQNSFMLRCRIPAGELTAAQLEGLAEIAESFGNGKAAITTRSNIQIREIAPKNIVQVITRLQRLALTSKGSGVDNVRNITASPTAGIDPQEFIDTRPFAHALHHYILNQRELFGLPRKFNVAFEGGGAVDTVADTNDIGFMAVKLAAPAKGKSLKDGSEIALDPGVYFRVELAGITGHKQLARDAGILVKPNELVALAAAMVRVFSENGDRTDRKKARLKYLLEKWGFERFLAETQKKMSFSMVLLPENECIKRPPAVRHGHIGVYRQKQKGRNYVGVVIPVGMMTSKQMRRLAEVARNYGNGELRLTPWQNIILADVPDGFVETVKRNLVRIGFHHSSSNIAGALVACTGTMGCKYANTDTKGDAVALTEYLAKKVQMDHPINIHLTGCPNSCAQHYVGDIGLQGIKLASGAPGYNVVFGGGTGAVAGIGKEIFRGLSVEDTTRSLERALKVYLARRQNRETFAEFTRRHEVRELQEMFA